jgi:hypothetical protein
MNKIKGILLITVLFYGSLAYSQSIKFGFQTGVGAYSMGELEYFTSSVYKSLPFQAKVTSDYPPYLYFKPSVLLSFKRINFGFQVSKLSTGSRISSKDYSGEYLFNAKVKCLAPSVYFDYGHFSMFNRFKVSVFIETGIIFSKLELKEYLTLNDQVMINYKYNFTSKNYYAEPGLKIEYLINKILSAEFSSSYSIQFGKKNFVTSDGMTINGKNSGVGPDWSGLRFGISFIVTYPLRQVK